MSEELTGVNEQEVAAPANTEQVQQTEVTSVNTSEVAEPVNNTPVQDDATNARFAELRRTAEKEARDNLIKEFFGESHGITSYEQYQEALRQQELAQEAERQGTDPRVLELEQRLGSIEFEKKLIQQDQMLTNDPDVGELYKQLKPEIVQLANENPGTDYDTAFTVLLRMKAKELMTTAAKKGEQEAVKGLINNATTSPGALGADGAEHKFGYDALSAEEKRVFREKVKRGEITS